ncbi:hypothetical protein L596_008220 [Steinernema carpocapsae]|uniref:Uncharacterized protein n=1 Tax=Steinernema carpocapsae TaxID=34508 RepID=A0A4U5PC36_STECR|nr:hypothetical protein L596_008220 [Steinernema carpocapsae]
MRARGREIHFESELPRKRHIWDFRASGTMNVYRAADRKAANVQIDYNLLLERIPDFPQGILKRMRDDPELDDLREVLVGFDRYRAKLLKLTLISAFYASEKLKKDVNAYKSPTEQFIEDTKEACAFLTNTLTESAESFTEHSRRRLAKEARKFIVSCLQMSETLDIICEMVDKIIGTWVERLQKQKWERAWVWEAHTTWTVLYELFAGSSCDEKARARMMEVLDFWTNECKSITEPTLLHEMIIMMLNDLFALFTV